MAMVTISVFAKYSVFVMMILVVYFTKCEVHSKSLTDKRVATMEVLEDQGAFNSQKYVNLTKLMRGSFPTQGQGHFSAESNAHRASKTDVKSFDVTIDLQRVVSTTGPKFIGVTLDSSIFRRKWKNFDVNNTTVQNLAKALSPSFIRVGGSAADFFIFSDTTIAEKTSVKDVEDLSFLDSEVLTPKEKNYTVTGEEWERLSYFIQVAGWDLIFDVNEFWRKDGHWDPGNARELLNFSQQRNFRIPLFQLGNEPNSYFHNFHFKIPGSELASDMKRLQTLLSDFPAYSNSSIIGPDVTKVTKDSAKEYLQEFLSKGGQDVVSAVTLHHYYFNAEDKGVKLSDFYNTTILDTLDQELAIGTSVVKSLAPQHPVWLSETSSISGGGLEGASNGYVAGFMWLDKLGLSALYGLQAVLRQSFTEGNYALISDADFFPYPDYFLTVLHKRLVQGAVFNVTSSTETVRVYASCANPATYQKGALTVYALNVKDESTLFNLTQFADQLYDVYLLTPGDEGGMMSAYSALNGEKLVVADSNLPPMRPSVQKGPITFPPYSFGFIVIPKAGIGACS